MKSSWGLLVFLVIGIALGFLLRGKHQGFHVVTKTDTLTMRETIRIESPVEVRYKVLRDTMHVPVRDTVTLHDTLYAVVGREIKEYEGEQYKAKVSGYDPRLDYIEVYPETRLVTTTERVAPAKNAVMLGTEIGYVDDFSIPIYIEYERRLHNNVGVYGKIVHDMHSSSSGVAIGARIHFGW